MATNDKKTKQNELAKRLRKPNKKTSTWGGGASGIGGGSSSGSVGGSG